MDFKKRIAILTSGGDAPGMNQVLYTICNQAINNNIEPYVVINGYQGLYDNDIRLANLKILKNSVYNAGSIIYCSRFDKLIETQIYEQCINNLNQLNIEYLIVLGGNGSYLGAKLLAKNGIKVICIPCTIDNDINFTQYTIGFASALNTIVENINCLHANAHSHGNIYIIEIMGRKCNDLTISAALASNVDYVVTNNNIKSKDELLEIIKSIKNNKREVFVLVTENIYNHNELVEVSNYIQEQLNISTKIHILGFVQRGAKPTGIELLNASLFANYAIECINKNIYNVALGLSNGKINSIDLINNNFSKKENEENMNNFINLINKKIF